MWKEETRNIHSLKFTFRIITALAALLVFTPSSFAQHYWTGGNGLWDNPAKWSSEPNGPGGFGIPTAQDDVIFFNENGEITIPNEAHCANLTVQNGNGGSLSGGNLHLSGNVSNQTSFAIQCEKLVFEGGTTQLFNSPHNIEADVIISENTTLVLQSNLMLALNELKIEHGHLDATGRAIACANFAATNSHTTLLLHGTKIVVSEALYAHPSIQASQLEETVYPEITCEVDPGPLWVSYNRESTCGTLAGQTPFTISTSVVSDYNGEDVSCNNSEDGEAFVSVIGGVGPFSYSWVGGPMTPNYPGMGAGTYTVLVADIGQGITCVDNIQLTEPAQLTVVEFNYNPPSCAGECNGSGLPVVNGGVSPYTYSWSNGEDEQFATMLCEGPNAFTFSDINGCVFDTTFTVELDEIFVNLDITNILCFGTDSGEATANPSGGDGGPYTITWDIPATGPTVTGLGIGDYVVTVEDATGCLKDSTFTITEEPPVLITIDNTVDPNCADTFDGSIDATIVDGTEPYVIEWTGPNAFTSDQEDLTGLESGTYDLLVTDDNGCTALASVDLTGPAAIVADETITDLQCFGDGNGAIGIVLSGGDDPFDTDWTGPNGFVSANEDIFSLEGGEYTLVVTDDSGCEATFVYTVDEPEEIIIDATVTPIACNGSDDGSIELVITGGSDPYTIDWSGPNGFFSNQPLISNLEPGDYNLLVFDDAGCFETLLFTLDDPAPIDIDIDLSPISCEGAADASVDVTVTGGSPDYLFDWSGPGGFTSDQEDLTDLDEGVYNLILTDASGCVVPASVVVANPDPIITVLVPSDVSCGGSADGEIELSILGGSPDYQTDWVGPDGFISDEEDLTDLIAGEYFVTITDVAGCSIEASTIVGEVPPLEATLDVTPITCNGEDNASIDLTMVGGQPPYQFNWAGPNLFISNDEDLSNLEPGLYNLLVIDENDCFIETAVQITAPDPIDVVVDQTNPTCFDSNDGTITLTISGGTEPFNVTWDSGDAGAFLEDLPEGDYTPTITDDAGCELVLPAITITAPEELLITTDVTQIQCGAAATGAIDLEFTGGQGDVVISWTGPDGFVSDQEDLTDLEEGVYDLLLTDEAGCTAVTSIELLPSDPLVVTSALSPLLCADDLGTIDLTITGGTLDYVIAWTGPNDFVSDQEDLSGLEQGIYDLMITDAAGCTYEESFDLSAPDPLVVDSDVTDLICGGGEIGAVDLTISGGTPPYDVIWTGDINTTEEDISNLGEGTYDVLVTDDGGCSVNLSFEFIQPDELDIEVTAVDPLCAGENTGSISILINGGTEPYDVLWAGPNAFASTATDLSNLEAGSYDLTV
ncbi:MAG: hypothetical protein ACJAYM_000579, partial [Flavobacteriales bacterium]